MEDDYDEKIAAEREGLARRQEAIRADGNLSPDGRRNSLREAYDAAIGRCNDLDLQRQQQQAREGAAAERAMWGLPAAPTATEVLLYRQAQKDAAVVRTPAEAAAKLEDATKEGDSSAERALFRHVYQQAAQRRDVGGNGWIELLNRYLEANPGLQERAEQHWNLTAPLTRDQQLRRSMLRPSRPAELRRG